MTSSLDLNTIYDDREVIISRVLPGFVIGNDDIYINFHLLRPFVSHAEVGDIVLVAVERHSTSTCSWRAVWVHEYRPKANGGISTRDPDRPVIDSVCDLIQEEGGRLLLAHICHLHPEDRAYVQMMGGLQAFCEAHCDRLMWVDDGHRAGAACVNPVNSSVSERAKSRAQVQFKSKIARLFVLYPDGISLDALPQAYEQAFGLPPPCNEDDILDLLKQFPDLVEVKGEGPFRTVVKASVVDALCVLIREAGGILLASRVGQLCRARPEARAHLRKAGGLKGFCELFPDRLEFVLNNGADAVRLAQKPNPVKNDIIIDELLIPKPPQLSQDKDKSLMFSNIYGPLLQGKIQTNGISDIKNNNLKSFPVPPKPIFVEEGHQPNRNIIDFNKLSYNDEPNNLASRLMQSEAALLRSTEELRTVTADRDALAWRLLTSEEPKQSIPSHYEVEAMTTEELNILMEKLRNCMQSVEAVRNRRLKCVVCSVRERRVVLLPCKHRCVCKECQFYSKCPLCNVPISERLCPDE